MESIAPDGRIGAPLDSNRQVEFNAQDHRHFDPGYAVTSVPSDLLNSRFGYVSNSRASHEATLVTDEMNKLASKICVEISKTSALKVCRTPVIAQGTGMS